MLKSGDMLLIADSGSSKTDWAFVPDGGQPLRFSCGGYNPNFVSPEEMRADILRSLPPQLSPGDVREVCFYGSGVAGQDGGPLCRMLSEVFHGAEKLCAFSDLFGAARALLGREAGFAAILGTGANSCLYDGEKISLKVPSLGFILGDEGSGASIGRALLRDYARGNMPPEIQREFGELVGKDADGIIEQVYRRPRANSYCAQFSRWAGERRAGSTYCRELLKSAFRDFFRNIVSLYPDYRKFRFNCVGSLAQANADLLAETAAEFGMETGRIVKSPLDGLIAYHLQSRL